MFWYANSIMVDRAAKSNRESRTTIKLIFLFSPSTLGVWTGAAASVGVIGLTPKFEN